MSPYLFNCFGMFSVHIYGVCIATGLLIYLLALKYDTKVNQLMSYETLTDLIITSVIIGIVSGRILFILETKPSTDSLFQFLSPTVPGFSLLGSILGVSLFLLYQYKNSPILNLKIFDRCALYAPIIQAFGRIGCYFTGCCYGTQTHVWWATVYTHQDHVAPLYCKLHPTQLYSAASLFTLFTILYLFQNKWKKPGIIVSLYLMGLSTERFFVEFLRADRTFISNYVSTSQTISIIIFITGLTLFYDANKRN